MTLAEQLTADLARLVTIPTIGSSPDHAADLTRSAETIAGMLAEVGCPDVRVVEGPYAPAVIGRWPAPPGKPTICFYAHHDVQALGDRAVWEYDPLAVTPVGRRLYGRGTADDKGGIVVHLATMRAFEGQPPVGVTIFVEGEEEIGSPHILDFLRDHADLIRADAYVICDAGNWAEGEPAFTTTLRGVCDAVIEVQTLDHAVHSGQFGGPAPDGLTALCRLLATLHDEAGDVAIAGLRQDHHFTADYSSQAFRTDAGLLDGVQEIGTGSIANRLWAKPSLTVIGLDTVSVAESSNTLLPSARARVSLRVPPGMTALEALDALEAHCLTHAPWGAHVRVSRGQTGNPGEVPTDGPLVQAGLTAYAEAYGEPVIQMGMGGAIPLVGELREAFPEAEFLVTGIADPDARMHSPNESVSLPDLVKTIAAQVKFLQALA